jgi:UDP-glucose 4-epimerase
MANVVVTGGAGRLGRLAVDELRSAGHQVTSIDRAAWAGAERPGVIEVVTDLGDPRATAEAVHTADVIVHLAAQLLPVESCLSENQESTWNVLMAAARGGSRRVVYASSVYAFGHHCGFTTQQFPAAPQLFSVQDVLAVQSFPITEQDEPAPRDRYSVSKRLNELTAEAVARAHGIEVVGLRFGDIWFDALRDWWKSPPVPERPEPGRKFDFWNYVDAGDAARAIRCAVEVTGLPNSSVVFVMADDTQLRETTRAAIASALPELEALLPASFDARQSLFSNSRAEEVLGWIPQVSWTDFAPVDVST